MCQSKECQASVSSNWLIYWIACLRFHGKCLMWTSFNDRRKLKKCILITCKMSLDTAFYSGAIKWCETAYIQLLWERLGETRQCAVHDRWHFPAFRWIIVHTDRVMCSVLMCSEIVRSTAHSSKAQLNIDACELWRCHVESVATH